ncbi:MAG: hypothetical protein ACC633_00570 [Anaerolineales bacterium]
MSLLTLETDSRLRFLAALGKTKDRMFVTPIYLPNRPAVPFQDASQITGLIAAPRWGFPLFVILNEVKDPSGDGT